MEANQEIPEEKAVELIENAGFSVIEVRDILL
jgi:hypothetical protein